MKIDLHTHSTASDGLYTPTELVQHAREAGLDSIALTDHDTTNGLAEALEAGKARHVEVIPSIEVNTDIADSEVHVLGYFLDYQQAAFQRTLQTLRDMRVTRAQRMVDKLRALGLNITWERVRELGALLAGKATGRKQPDEITLFKSIGLAIEDVAVGGWVYEQAQKAGIGRQIEL